MIRRTKALTQLLIVLIRRGVDSESDGVVLDLCSISIINSPLANLSTRPWHILRFCWRMGRTPHVVDTSCSPFPWNLRKGRKSNFWSICLCRHLEIGTFYNGGRARQERGKASSFTASDTRSFTAWRFQCCRASDSRIWRRPGSKIPAFQGSRANVPNHLPSLGSGDWNPNAILLLGSIAFSIPNLTIKLCWLRCFRYKNIKGIETIEQKMEDHHPQRRFWHLSSVWAQIWDIWFLEQNIP